jgi:hypothetical protein
MEVGDLHDKLHGIAEHQQCTPRHRFRSAQLLKAMLIEILDEGQEFRFKGLISAFPIALGSVRWSQDANSTLERLLQYLHESLLRHKADNSENASREHDE